jgi:hypothetical protein
MEKFDNFEPTPTNSAANNNIERPAESLDVQAMSTSLILEESLQGAELIQNLTAKIESNPQLKSRLGFENLDHISLELKVAETVDQLRNIAGGMVMMAELIAIILVNPKGLIKEYKKFGLVLAQNDAILKQIDQELDNLTSDESKLKAAAGYLGKLIARNNPSSKGIAAVTYLSKLVGVVSEEEYQQMETNATLIKQPVLNSWIIMEVIRSNPDLAQSIYEIATSAHSEYQNHKEQKAA